MQKHEAAAYIAGLTPSENASESQTTNVHIITATVEQDSDEGTALVSVEGMVFGESDDQYFEVDTIGGLLEGDTTSLLLTGEPGHAMTPLSLGGVGTVDRVVKRVSEIEADYVQAGYLEANYAHIHEGVIDNAQINDANIVDGSITGTKIRDATITGAQIASTTITGSNIANGTITATQIQDSSITGSKIDASTFTNGQISGSKIDASTFTNGQISGSKIDASTFTNGQISGTKIDGSTLTNIPSASIVDLSANYARIDASNITELTARDAWINNLLVQSGLLAHEGTIFTLDAIQVDAVNITAGTIDVERLIVSNNGEKYLVHVDEVTGQPTYEKLDGNIVQPRTIAADKIVAGSITTQEITTENLVGTGGWINLRNGTFAYVNATTGQGISWDGQHLSISGSVTISPGSSRTLADIANAVDSTLIYDHTYEFNQAKTQATFTAHLFQGGVDIAPTYAEADPSPFTWYRKSETPDEQGNTTIYLGSGLTCVVNMSDMGYGSHIIGKFTTPNESELLDSNDNNLTTSEDDNLIARTPSGDSVRVSDLSVATVLYSTDKLMVVGPEDEHLVTISTIQAYLEANLTKQVRFGTTAQWNAQSTLESEANTLYIYTDRAVDSLGNAIAGIKVGDGNAYLVDLPFTDNILMDHIADTTRHITSEEREFWNNKVRCYATGQETLVFTTS